MSVIEQTVRTSNSPRRIPATVRLGSEVVNDLCIRLRSETAAVGDDQAAVGLLFGTAVQDTLSVKAFKAFFPADSAETGSSQRECLDAAFERSLATAKTDQDLTNLELVGWYCIRRPGDIAPLSESDIEFHNRRFRRATDVALLLKPKQHAGASIDLIELYSRSSLNAALSRQDYRSGSLLLAGSADVNTASDVTMRGNIDDEYYLKVFQTLDSLDRAEKRQGWKRIALWLKAIRPLSLRPKSMRTRLARAIDPTAPDTSSVPANATNRMLPAARSQTKLSWILPAALVVLAMGLAFGWFYARPLFSRLPVNALFLRTSASTPFNMRVEPQTGGSLLVKWDTGSAAVQAAKKGIVQIDDGSEHHDVPLDSNEVANGSILYTPISKDLTFRLQVFGGDGTSTFESMRVVNGSKSTLAPHTVPNARSRTLAKTAIEKGRSEATTRPNGGAPGQSVHPAATSSSASVDKPNPSATTASRAMRPPTRNVSEPKPKSQALQNPVSIDSAKSPAGEPLPAKRNSSPGKPESSKTVQDVHSTQSQSGIVNDPTSMRYVPPRPLKQVMPSAMDLTSSAWYGASDIEVEVRIDDEGRVTAAQVVNTGYNSNERLTNAALAAAREWIFEPAQMHGKNVVSYHTIKFHFHPHVGQQ
jgi:TonB family protein